MVLLYKSASFYTASLPPFVMMVVTYTVPVTPECPAICVPISPVMPELGTIVPKLLTVPVDIAPVVPKLCAVLMDVAPTMLVVLGHRSKIMGTCPRDPERYSHQPTNDPSCYASHGHIPHLQGDARFLAGQSHLNHKAKLIS